MKLELKNVKLSMSQSEETMAYTATLYVDGVMAAYCKNSGRGEADHIQFLDPSLGAKVAIWASEQPPLYPEITNATSSNIEDEVGKLLTKYTEDQQLRKWCKTKTVLLVEGSEPGMFVTLKGHHRREVVDAWVSKHFPGKAYEVINERFA